MFSGQLPHAGAHVDYTGYTESMILRQIETIVRVERGRDHKFEIFYENTFNRLCRVRDTDKVTRFHVFLTPKDSTVRHDPNNVARKGYAVNPEF